MFFQECNRDFHLFIHLIMYFYALLLAKLIKYFVKFWSNQKELLPLHSQSMLEVESSGNFAYCGPFVYRLGREIFIL